MRGHIPQEAVRLAHVGQAVANVARAVGGLGVGRVTVRHQVVAQQPEQVVERGAVAHGHVVDLVQGGLGEAPTPALPQRGME